MPNRVDHRTTAAGAGQSGVIHHAQCPVAVIHDEDLLMPYPGKAPVVVGIDGSAASEPATAIAFDEASRRGVELVAVHAWSDFAAFELPGLQSAVLKQEAKEALAARLAGWQERYPDVPARPDSRPARGSAHVRAVFSTMISQATS